MIDTITIGDCRELSKQIENSSIDMLFTDPPYHMKYMYLYEWLAEEAPRVMKDGAWAFVYGGWVAKEIFEILYSGDWNYFMTIALLNKGSYPRWWSKQLMIGWKPVYVFTKGDPTIMKWQANIYDKHSMDKRYHSWGQGAGFAVEKIEMFTGPGDLVYDPFCGGGTTAEACITTGRHFITFELEEETAKIAKKRIKNTNRPLFIMPPVQIEIPFDIQEGDIQ